MSWRKFADPLASITGNEKRSPLQGLVDPLGLVFKEKKKPVTIDSAVVAPASMKDVIGTGTDTRRNASKRRGFMASVKAGETGSNQQYQSTTGVRSLLGVP